jgi:hypothetical protein
MCTDRRTNRDPVQTRRHPAPQEAPDSAARLTTATRVVIAEGEKTGHAHAIVGDDVELYEREGTLFVSVSYGAHIEHEEHATLELPPGTYEVVRQREYEPGPSRSYRWVQD